ncbi:putative Tubulin gamma-1 chain [Blattamonas nauphoetae]|uniref:Tubulin gamma chain n=1 Tax=Blattamonas nauphoetae TaxID=2049346 RepID=A0ABQ9XE07_9EUKA|nr:putative Tubulin gamma-1 chain [Blattamonas nauphoetae]
MREIITLQVGQCGNQIGKEFWTKMSAEHGISKEGVVEHPEVQANDRKDVFFYQADDDRYVPRSILVDLEGTVLDTIRTSEMGRFYNSENFFMPETSREGGGAGNLWSSGYDQAGESHTGLFENIDREAEGCDSLEGFILCHSLAGGTGSGYGSYLLEKLRERYPDKLIQTYSVFPAPDGSDVVVQTYNSILTMQRLIEHADATVVLDNVALNQIAEEKLKLTQPTVVDLNEFISTVMVSSTATMRFPGYMYNDLGGIIASLVPTPRCHFLMTSYTPLASQNAQQAIRKTSVHDVMRRLIEPHNLMVSCSRSEGVYASILNIIQPGSANSSDIDQTAIHKSLQQLRAKQRVKFVPWCPASIQVAVAKRSPFIEQSSRVSGLMLANHTSITTLFEKILKDFWTMLKNKAFLFKYAESNVIKANEKEFDDCGNAVASLISEYRAMEDPLYGSLTPIQ